MGAFYLSQSVWGSILRPMSPNRDVKAYRTGFDHGDLKLVPFFHSPQRVLTVDEMYAIACEAWSKHQEDCRITTTSGSLRKVCEALAGKAESSNG